MTLNDLHGEDRIDRGNCGGAPSTSTLLNAPNNKPTTTMAARPPIKPKFQIPLNT